MTVTAIAQITTARGLAQQRDLAGTPEPFTLPANNYRNLQDGPVKVLVEHDEGFECGHVAALVRGEAVGLLGVLRVDGPAVDLLDDGSDWFVSAGVNTRRGGQPLERAHAQLFEVSLTRSPAVINTRPLRWSRTDIHTDAGGQPAGLPLSWRSAWSRAHEALQRRAYRRADRLWIIDLDPPDPDGLRQRQADEQRRRAAAANTAVVPDARVFRHRVGGRIIDPAALC